MFCQGLCASLIPKVGSPGQAKCKHSWLKINITFFCLLNNDCMCMSVDLNCNFFSMLVNVYGSKDLFVSEYRTLLADRILSSFNYDTEKEVISCTFVFVYQCVKLFSMWGITSTDFHKFKFSQVSQKVCAFWAPTFSSCLTCFKSLAMEIFGFWNLFKFSWLSFQQQSRV